MATPMEPLFVLGAPRSGTSVLYRALALHPEASWINNWLRRAPGVAPLSAFNRIATALPGARRRVWFGADGANAYRYGQRRGLAERLFPQPVEGEPVFEHHGVLPGSAARPVTAAQLDLARTFEHLRRWGGGSVVVSKRIGHNRRVALLHEIFPDARFVLITRDGRAVASSLAKVDWWDEADLWWRDDAAGPTDSPNGGPTGGSTGTLELAARHWVEEVTAIEDGLATVPAEQVMRISYEELVARPWPTLSAVATFAGMSASPRWQRDVQALRFPDQNQGWRKRPAEEIDLINAVQEPVLTARGYV